MDTEIGGLVLKLREGEIVSINDGELRIGVAGRHGSYVRLVFEAEKTKYKIVREELYVEKQKRRSAPPVDEEI